MSEDDIRGMVPDIGGSYVIEGPLGCPDGRFPARTVTIPDTDGIIRPPLGLCYVGP